MKQFSKAWISSKNRSKQRKYRANAPKHIKQTLRSSRLSDELATKYGAKQAPVRVGDEVKIMRGTFAGKTGEVSAIHPYKRERVMIQGFEVERRDGQKRGISFDASNLLITAAEEDERRFPKGVAAKKPAKNAKKPVAKPSNEAKTEKSAAKANKKSGQESGKE